MERPHDLGGQTGFGPVPVEASEPFSAWWQQLAYALASMTARVAGVNPDALRHVMERIPPEDYQRLGPAGRWLRVAELCAVEGGLVAEGEVADRAWRRAAGEASPEGDSYPEPGPNQFGERHGPEHNKREPPEGAEPAYAVGRRVRTIASRPAGHTRLPGYLWGKGGEVVGHNGYWVFPDSHARPDGPEAPTWVYTVRFRADELWPGAGSHHVSADLYEPYLEAVDG